MNDRDQHPHEPVLLEETVSALVTDKNGIYIDCTIGFSGHSFAILQKINKRGKLFGIDYDPYALEYSKNRLSELDKTYELFLSNYTEFRSLIKTKNIKKVNGIWESRKSGEQNANKTGKMPPKRNTKKKSLNN